MRRLIPVLVSLAAFPLAAHAAPAGEKSAEKAPAKSTAKTTAKAASTGSAKTSAAKAVTKSTHHAAPAADATMVVEPAPSDAALVAAAAPTSSASPEEVAALHAEIAALHDEIVGLHADVTRLLPPAPEAAPEAAMDPQKEARRAAAQSEIDAVAAQRSLLDSAVTGGLDAHLAESARAALDARQTAAEADLAAIDAPAEVASPAEAASPSAPSTTWAVDAGVASAYAFRGANIFADTSAQDQNALFAPSVTASFGDSGVSVGWWGGYQLSGDNAVAMVDVGLGAENDLFVSWGTNVSDTVKVGAAFTGYLYPFATADAAGTDFPVYVEPAASVTWSPGVDVGLAVAYTYGAQEALATYGRYVYVHPTVAKNVELPAGFVLGVGAGAGVKGFASADAGTDNMWDVSGDVSVQKNFDGGFYVKPGAHAVWTNREGQGFAESSFGWFGVNVGATL